MEEGTETELPPYEFGVVVGEPVRFRFFSSTVRRDDQVGVRHDHWSADELEELDEIEITLPVEGRAVGEVVPVSLAAAVTETGTLRLDAVAVDGNHRWKIEYDVRAGDDGVGVGDHELEYTDHDASNDSTSNIESNDEHVPDSDMEEHDDQPANPGRFGNLFGKK
jgi:hypothetical protein